MRSSRAGGADRARTLPEKEVACESLRGVVSRASSCRIGPCEVDAVMVVLAIDGRRACPASIQERLPGTFWGHLEVAATTSRLGLCTGVEETAVASI